MLTCKTSVGLIGLTFTHTQYTSPDDPCHGATGVEVYQMDAKTCKPVALIGHGVAYCHKADQFNKETGRKIALARALMHLDKSLRGEVWAKYHARGVSTEVCKATE